MNRILVSLWIGITGLILGAAPGATQDQPLPVSVETLLMQSEFTTTQVYIGRVEARQQSAVGFELSGRVLDVAVDEGAQVSEGDVLARVDTERLEARLAEQNALVRQTQADLTLAEQTLERMERLITSESVTQQQLDEARRARNAQAAALERAEAAVASTEVDLRKSTLIAPYDAHVVKRWVDRGDVVDAGTRVLELQQTGTLEARIGLPLAIARKYPVGATVALEIHDAVISATVTALIRQQETRTRTVDVIVQMDEGDLIYPGELVQMRVVQTWGESGFVVPITALTEGIRGMWSVYVAQPSEESYLIERRMVDVLRSNETHAFVLGSLRDGERIVSTGVQRIVPGQRVMIAGDDR